MEEDELGGKGPKCRLGEKTSQRSKRQQETVNIDLMNPISPFLSLLFLSRVLLQREQTKQHGAAAAEYKQSKTNKTGSRTNGRTNKRTNKRTKRGRRNAKKEGKKHAKIVLLAQFNFTLL